MSKLGSSLALCAVLFAGSPVAQDVTPSCIKNGNLLLVHLPIEIKYDIISGEAIDRVYRKIIHIECDLRKGGEICNALEVNRDSLLEGALGPFDLTLMSNARVMENTRDMMVVKTGANIFVIDFVNSSVTWRISKEGMSAYGLANCPESWLID